MKLHSVFIYKINGKIYVGQTTQVLDQCFEQHSRTESPLDKNICEYGITNFKIEILAACSGIGELKKIER